MTDAGSGITRQLQTLFSLGTAGALSDGELLERFATRRDAAAEAAFASLVERHGPVVLRVCRDILGDPDDAEDAFQATFLVLVRRAGSIRKRDSLGSWPYGVALRVAACARSSTARRRVHERKAAGEVSSLVPEGCVTGGDELAPALHEEVGRLPEKYREAVVMCYWQGLTHEQAAERLRWPVGTVRSRLSWARQRLRSRLTRRGLSPSAALPFATSSGPAMADALLSGTVQGAMRVAAGQAASVFISASALSLTEGVIRTMIFTRWKLTAMVLLTVGIATAGAGGLAYQEPDAPGSSATTRGEAPRTVPPDRLADPDAQIENLKTYLRELQAKVKEKQKEWLEMAAGLNDEQNESTPGPPGVPTVPQMTPRRTMVEEYKSVRELAFKANMDLIEAEAQLNVRKAENPASAAEVDRERAIQKQIEVELRNDPEIAALTAQVEAARRVDEQAARLVRFADDPARANARRKLSALTEKLKDLADGKREAIAKRLRDQGVDERNTSFPDLKERRDLYEKLLGVIEKINRQRGIDSVKMDLLREELSSLRGMQDSVSKRIEQMQFEANRR